jgi:hypothetical protein
MYEITPQAPIRSGFGPLTTAREVLSGRDQMLSGVLPWAIEPEMAERLWRLSEEMTGVKFAS